MDLSLDLVIEAARRRRAAITPEGAGYIVLLATQQLIEHPCRVLPADLLLQDDGEVRVRALPRASEPDVEAALRTLLATLLALSATPAPAISAVVERDGGAGLRALASELSAALIPINHAAARRALARLYRETRKAGSFGGEHVPTAAAAPAATVGALVGALRAPSVAGEAWPELDIDVEIVREVAQAERVAALPIPSAPELRESQPSGLASSAPHAPEERDVPPPGAVERTNLVHPAADAEVPSPSCRSNIRELLASYLAQTRAEEPMTRALRDMIGLAAPPLPSDAPLSPRRSFTVSR